MRNEQLEKDCFRFTEKLLYNYKHIESRVYSLEYEIGKLKAGDILSIRAIRYDDIKTSPTNQVSKQTEDKVINIVSYVQDLEIEVYKEKQLKKRIDKAINNLKPIHKQIIQLKYNEGLEWQEIVNKVYLEERQLRTKKNEAIKSISIELFGTKVFKEEDETLFAMIDL